MKYRVLNSEGAHAFWATEEESGRLIRAGMARTFGSRRRVRGLRLTVTVSDAGHHLFGSAARSKLGVFREHVAGRFYIFQHTRKCEPGAAAHIALAAAA